MSEMGRIGRQSIAEVKNYKDEFIIIQDNRQLKRVFSLAQNHIRFLDLDDNDYPKVHQIADIKQLKKIIENTAKKEKFKGLIITK